MMNDGFGSFPVLGEFDQCPEFILINKDHDKRLKRCLHPEIEVARTENAKTNLPLTIYYLLLITYCLLTTTYYLLLTTYLLIIPA